MAVAVVDVGWELCCAGYDDGSGMTTVGERQWMNGRGEEGKRDRKEANIINTARCPSPHGVGGRIGMFRG